MKFTSNQVLISSCPSADKLEIIGEIFSKKHWLDIEKTYLDMRKMKIVYTYRQRKKLLLAEIPRIKLVYLLPAKRG